MLFPRALEPDTYDTLVGACAANGFTPAVAQEATSLQTILGLVASGLGTAFVAESVMTGTQRDGVTFRRLAGSAPEITTAIAWRDDTDNPSIGVFRRVVDATLRC